MQKPTPQSQGGVARSAKLTPEQRSAIAREAAATRWQKLEPIAGQKIAKAAVTGILKIGEASLQCAVLEDENNTRIFTQSGFLTALGRFPTPPSARSQVLDQLPAFLRARNLEPFISNGLACSSTPIVFEAAWGGGRGGRSLGFPARLLPEVCWVYHNAERAGALVPAQKHIADQCTILLRGLTNVAIDALVDEATGWQYIRERNELQKLLSAYVSEELLPWAAAFPDEYYEEMFRLWKWEWPPKGYTKGSPKGPRYAGKLTNKLIYDQLPEGVADELKSKAPPDDNWQGRIRLWKHLTPDIGNAHLEKQLAVATNIMKVCDDKEEFQQKYEKAFPGTFDKARQLSFSRKLLDQHQDEEDDES